MGLGLGLAAGISPGPLLALLISSTLERGFGAGLRVIAALIDAGKIRPHVSQVFDLADVAQAHEKSEGGHTRGKLVLQTSSE